MDNSLYLSCKNDLKLFADEVQIKDKPARRQALNDYTDSLIRDLGNNCLVEAITEKQYSLYSQWLVNYCIKRHEK